MSVFQSMSALPRDPWRLFESSDVDETRERISRVLQPHHLTPLNQGRHSGSMNYVSLGGVGIGTIRFGEMSVDLEEVEDYHLFIFCLAGQAEMNIHHDELGLQGTQGVCIAPGTPFRGRFSHDCEQLVLRVDRQALRESNEGRLPRFRTRVDMNSPASAPWANVLQSLIRDSSALRMVQNDRLIARNYERLLLSLLIAGEQDVEPARFAIAPVAVRKAETFIKEQFASPITLADIARAAGVPPRTLLDNFKKFRGESPMKALHRFRMENARKLLQSGQCDGVTDAAYASGLSHLGRFSRDFRTQFGQLPSEARTSDVFVRCNDF